MKKIVYISFILLAFNLMAQDDYVIEIGGQVMEISLDKKYEVPIGKNKVSFTVRLKDTLTYESELYSFSYLKDFKISEYHIDEGINQILLMTGDGSGIIIQTYNTINPTMLNEMMLYEVTKESISYGYELTRDDYKRTLKSGQTINVYKAILTYKENKDFYEIVSIGHKDEGILIMTMNMDENLSNHGSQIIDLMWDTLEYK